MDFDHSPDANIAHGTGESHAAAASHSAHRELTDADYDHMSRAARTVSTHRSQRFMDAFKKANPDWTPDFSKLG